MRFLREAALTEADYLAEVYSLCEKAPCLYHHCGVSYRCAGHRGFPDLIIIGYRGVLFREVKTVNDRPTPDQTAMMWLLKAAGMDAEVWTESDLASGKVAREIAGIS